jgi:hypothetical protein
LTAFGRQLVRGEVRNLLAVQDLVPDPEGSSAKCADDPELVRDALWALRQPVP